MTSLDTRRLQLKPFAPENILALIEGHDAFARSFGAPAAEGLGDGVRSAEVSPAWLAALRSATAADSWTHGFAAIDRESGLVIGTVGFKGPPDADGVVEIAYGIAAGLQRRGYATEACGAGVSFAFADARVRTVRAHTLPTARASMRVLEKNGFTHVGDVQDSEDGLVCRWERKR